MCGTDQNLISVHQYAVLACKMDNGTTACFLRQASGLRLSMIFDSARSRIFDRALHIDGPQQLRSYQMLVGTLEADQAKLLKRVDA